jgi:hypothetical protein
MAEPRRTDKALKRDVTTIRDVREEIAEEITPSGAQPRQKHPNRDRARGDWDRTGDHFDEGTSRAEE